MLRCQVITAGGDFSVRVAPNHWNHGEKKEELHPDRIQAILLKHGLPAAFGLCSDSSSGESHKGGGGREGGASVK